MTIPQIGIELLVAASAKRAEIGGKYDCMSCDGPAYCCLRPTNRKYEEYNILLCKKCLEGVGNMLLMEFNDPFEKRQAQDN